MEIQRDDSLGPSELAGSSRSGDDLGHDRLETSRAFAKNKRYNRVFVLLAAPILGYLHWSRAPVLEMLRPVMSAFLDTPTRSSIPLKAHGRMNRGPQDGVIKHG